MKDIIAKLISYSAPHVFNPWSDIDPMYTMGIHSAKARISRLESHFDCKPSYLLIGEAPGYQGCHFSGVPFTNEKLILDGVIPRVTWRNRITTRGRPWSEPSATIVWRTLHHLGIADDVVLCNCFHWHPHQPGDPYTNRTPTRAEIEAGQQLLFDITAHFAGATRIAIGRLAKHALDQIGLKCAQVRHPSMGGAKEFAAGLERIVDAKAVTA